MRRESRSTRSPEIPKSPQGEKALLEPASELITEFVVEERSSLVSSTTFCFILFNL